MSTAPDRVVYLSSSLVHCRIPVCEELAKLWSSFTVVTLRHPGNVRYVKNPNEAVAWTAGAFNRRYVAGRWVAFTDRDNLGLATSTGMVVAPGVVPLLVRLRPDIVIVNTYSLWTMAAMIGRAWGARVVIFSDGTSHTERTVGRARLLLRKCLARNAHAFVVTGRLARQYVEGLGVPAHRIVEGEMGFDVEGMRRTAGETPAAWLNAMRERLALRGPTFLTVAGLIRRKGLHFLITALGRVQRGGDACELIVVGTGPERAALEAQVRAEGVSGVHFVGAVPAEQVASYHRLADVFVLPTLHDHWSLAVVEAMANGLPVLTSPYNGLSADLVHEGESGFVIEPGNIETFAARLKFVCRQSREQLQAMGSRARGLVERYRPEIVAAAYAEAVRIARAA